MVSPTIRKRGIARCKIGMVAGPLAVASACLASSPRAEAETDITASQTTPVSTSAAGNVVITSTGSVNPTSGAAVTLDSNNTVDNEGAITINDANGASGILVVGGTTGSVTVGGSISVTDSTLATTIPLTAGENRYGIQVTTGSGPFVGSITQSGGTITIRGNDSAGILVTPGLTGSISLSGTIGVTGNNSFGLQTVGPVTGAVSILGSVLATGTGSSAVSLGGDVGGEVDVDASVRATGYYNGGVITARPTDATTLAGLTANNLLQGGPTVSVAGNVGGGILVDTSGSLLSYGSAPALLVAPTSGSTSIGIVDTGTDTSGVLIRGSVLANGIYDKFGATAIQVGGAGGAVAIDGGMKVASGGTVSANAYAANATGISFQAGSTVSTLQNVGTIKADVEFGANGNAALGGTATAILDNAGALSLVQNTGTISATTASGSAIALDLRADSSPVTVTQSSSGTTTASSITGDILFGSSNSTLNLDSGTLDGAVAFGAGTNSLMIAGGAAMMGALTTSGGNTAINVANGQLTMTNLNNVQLGSLGIGSSGRFNFGIDPASGQNAGVTVLGATIISTGAKIGLDFESKLVTPEMFTLIQASPAALANQPALAVGDIPYFYTATLQTNEAAGTIAMSVRDRPFAEAGVYGNAAAYNAIFTAFDRDPGIRDAFNGAVGQPAFSQAYRQLLPAYSGGLFETLEEGTGTLARAQTDQSVGVGGQRSGAWTQEFGFGAVNSGNNAPGYRAGGIGLAFGWEMPASSISTLGVSASYIRANVNDSQAGPGNHEVGAVYSGGVYWREFSGGIHADASLNTGIVEFNSERNFSGTDLSGAAVDRSADSSWTGGLARGHVGLSYEYPIGDGYFIRPEASGDYFVLYEGGHGEHNGGSALDLDIASRVGKQGSVEGGLTLGAEFDDEDFKWTPQMTVAWRQVFGGPDDTVAQFISGGQSFSLSAPPQKGGALVRLGIHGGNKYNDIAFEAGGEERGEYRAYNGQLVVHFRF